MKASRADNARENEMDSNGLPSILSEKYTK